MTAVDSGGFTRAACKVHQTQPAFSRSIQGLEAAIDESLFRRSRQDIALTTAWINFLPHTRKLLDRYFEALNSVAYQHA